MNTYREEDLRTALAASGVRAGDSILVHSALFALGVLEGVPIAAQPARLLRIIRELLGPRGNLIVPTFTFAFIRGQPFDRQNSPAEAMGSFSEFVRRQPDAIRSRHPLQSVAAIGADAGAICAGDGPSSFSDEGPFDWLVRQLDSKLVLLGAPMQAASLVHYVEERIPVPYRYWKEVSGDYLDAGQVTRPTYRFFARDLTLDPRLELARLEAWLCERGLVRTHPVGGGQVKAVRCRDFVQVAFEKLRGDPFALVKLAPSQPPPSAAVAPPAR